MLSNSNGLKEPGLIRNLFYSVRSFLQRITNETILIKYFESQIRFDCRNRGDSYRARTLFIKEPGTIDWINRYVTVGDTFLDIGANFGIYSLIAAVKVGRSGHVFAIEPHPANINSLVRNVGLNNFTNLITVIGAALGDTEGFFPFEFTSLDSSSSGSQINIHHHDGADMNFLIKELKFTTTVDSLIDSKNMSMPHHVKIDVDGVEYEILLGMQNLLSDPISRPKSVQVEVVPSNQDLITKLMEQFGYTIIGVHQTIAGQKLLNISTNPSHYRRTVNWIRQKSNIPNPLSVSDLLQFQGFNIIFGVAS